MLLRSTYICLECTQLKQQTFRGVDEQSNLSPLATAHCWAMPSSEAKGDKVPRPLPLHSNSTRIIGFFCVSLSPLEPKKLVKPRIKLLRLSLVDNRLDCAITS